MTNVTPVEVRKLTLPMDPLEMANFYKAKREGQPVEYMVDVDGSVEKLHSEAAMLRFVANLRIPCYFDKVTDTMLEEYLKLNVQIDSPTLRLIHANMLYVYKYGDPYLPVPELLNVYSVQQMKDFCLSHQQLIARQAHFLDCIPMYLLSTVAADGSVGPAIGKGTLDDVKQRKDSRDQYFAEDQFDKNVYPELNMSLVSIIQEVMFCSMWYAVIPPQSLLLYYVKHFDEYMYGGKNLFYYLVQSPLFALVDVAAKRDQEFEEKLAALTASLTAIGVAPANLPQLPAE